MDIISIKQFAEEQNVSYEAIRKQIVRYSEDLKEHIIRKNRTQYLDEWAIDFLKKKRRENPVILLNQDKDEEIDFLKSQIESLKNQLMSAQNELLTEKDKVIALQAEANKAIETKAKNEFLLEDNKEKEEKLRQSAIREADLSRQLGEKNLQLQSAQSEAENFKKQSEEFQKTVSDLQKQRDEFQTEAQSYQKSFFGFYRKK